MCWWGRGYAIPCRVWTAGELPPEASAGSTLATGCVKTGARRAEVCRERAAQVARSTNNPGGSAIAVRRAGPASLEYRHPHESEGHVIGDDCEVHTVQLDVGGEVVADELGRWCPPRPGGSGRRPRRCRPGRTGPRCSRNRCRACRSRARHHVPQQLPMSRGCTRSCCWADPSAKWRVIRRLTTWLWAGPGDAADHQVESAPARLDGHGEAWREGFVLQAGDGNVGAGLGGLEGDAVRGHRPRCRGRSWPARRVSQAGLQRTTMCSFQ